MGRCLETRAQASEEGNLMIDNDDEDRPVMEPMSLPEKARLLKLMGRLKEMYPGAAGEILAEYVDVWREFGYRLGDGARMTRLYKETWAARLPGELEPGKPADEWVEVV
jgi:hypothetical protein